MTLSSADWILLWFLAHFFFSFVFFFALFLPDWDSCTQHCMYAIKDQEEKNSRFWDWLMIEISKSPHFRARQCCVFAIRRDWSSCEWVRISGSQFDVPYASRAHLLALLSRAKVKKSKQHGTFDFQRKCCWIGFKFASLTAHSSLPLDFRYFSSLSLRTAANDFEEILVRRMHGREWGRNPPSIAIEHVLIE